MLKGSSIKAFRLRKNFTQDDLADRLGISQACLSAIENGKIDCPLNVEEKFFQIYERFFNRVDKDLFKERYPHNGIKLLGDSNDVVSFRNENNTEIYVNVITKLRRKLKFNREEFSKILGIPQGVLSRIENDNCKLSNDLYNDILLKYGSFLSDGDKLQLEKMIECSYGKIHNFVLNNNVNLIMEQIIDMKLQKSDVKFLFEGMLEQAKILKKERS